MSAPPSPELERVEPVWRRHDARLALPCTGSDVEVISIFEAFWLDPALGRPLLKRGLARRRVRGAADVTLDYAALASAMRPVVSDFEDLLFGQPHRVLRQLAVAAELTCSNADDERGTRRSLPSSSSSTATAVAAAAGGPLTIRLERVAPEMALANLRASTIGRLASVRASVTRVGPVKPLVEAATFRCAKCGCVADAPKTFEDGVYEPPTRCPSAAVGAEDDGGSGGCKSRSFELDRRSARTVDVQRIRIQQRYDQTASGGGGAPPEDDAGRMPRTLDVELVGSNLVESCVPGDVVIVSGVVRSLNADVASGRHDRRALQKSVFLLYLEAVGLYNVTRRDSTSSDDERSSSRLALVRELVASIPVERRAAALVHSLCPSILGQLPAKLGLLLGLFSGRGGLASGGDDEVDHGDGRVGGDDGEDDDDAEANKDTAPPPSHEAPPPEGTHCSSSALATRDSSHVLLVGDPGLGKSQLLRAAAAVAPRSIYVCGNTTSTTGLTASVARDASSRGSSLEAGALVLADRGACVIDEFDKMDPAQHAGLLEAMEQQQISVAKASVAATLSARTAVLAAANPVGGAYDRSRSVAENLGKLSAPLLSRFDLVFVLVDDPDAQKDSWLSSHVLRQHNRRRRGDGASNTRLLQSAASSSCFESAAGPLSSSSGDSSCGGGRLGALLGGGGPPEDPSSLVIPRATLREYVAHARARCHPRLSREAAALLRTTYLDARARVASSSQKNGDLLAPAFQPRTTGAARSSGKPTTGSAMPVTMRHLESLVRLAKARARMDLRRLVTREDAEDAVALLETSVRDTCRTASGALDFSRLQQGASEGKIVKALVAALHHAANAKRDPWFSMGDLKAMVQQHPLLQEAILAAPKQLRDFVEILRDQNYLMYQKRGPGGDLAYRLASCDFADHTPSESSSQSQRL